MRGTAVKALRKKAKSKADPNVKGQIERFYKAEKKAFKIISRTTGVNNAPKPNRRQKRLLKRMKNEHSK